MHRKILQQTTPYAAPACSTIPLKYHAPNLFMHPMKEMCKRRFEQCRHFETSHLILKYYVETIMLLKTREPPVRHSITFKIENIDINNAFEYG